MLKTLIIITFINVYIFSQGKTDLIYIHDKDTNYVPYMYLFNDTLDYSCGGTLEIAIKDLKIIKDNITRDYIIKGKLITKSGDNLGNWGFVTTGTIKKIEAKTWIGTTQTGLLCKDRPFIYTRKGFFTIRIPFYYNNDIIFSAEGGFTIMDFDFKQFLKDNLYN